MTQAFRELGTSFPVEGAKGTQRGGSQRAEGQGLLTRPALLDWNLEVQTVLGKGNRAEKTPGEGNDIKNGRSVGTAEVSSVRGVGDRKESNPKSLVCQTSVWTYLGSHREFVTISPLTNPDIRK